MGKYTWKEPLYLKIPRWICSTVVSLRLRKIVTDVTSGFKGENRLTTQYFKLVYETSSKIHMSNTNNMEEHLLAHKKGLRLTEVPVMMHNRRIGQTKCHTARQLFAFPLDFIRTICRNR